MPSNASEDNGAAPALSASENVYLFYPNLIGYARIILAAIALVWMPYHPNHCTILYGISALLDGVDGAVARRFGMQTNFGSVLDMLCDRCATSALMVFLAVVYPSYALLFQFLISLDYASHYAHCYASLVSGSKSHKSVSPSRSRILHAYYTRKEVLFSLCALNELFWVALYLIHFYDKPLGLDLLSMLPADIAKHIPFKVLYMTSNLSWPHLLAVISGPGMLIKQIINGVQLAKACRTIVELDLEQRAAKRLQIDARQQVSPSKKKR